MAGRKRRLTVTVDPELVDAGKQAIANGSAASLSGWVSGALAEQVRRDEKLAQLHSAIAEYEAEFGEITADEIAAQRRHDRTASVVVRGRPQGPTRSRRPRSAKARSA